MITLSSIVLEDFLNLHILFDIESHPWWNNNCFFSPFLYIAYIFWCNRFTINTLKLSVYSFFIFILVHGFLKYEIGYNGLRGVTPPIIRERLTYGVVVCFIVCYPINRLIINMNYRLGVTEAVMNEMKQDNDIL